MADGPGSKHWDGPGLDAWHAWHPAEVARRLAGLDIPWCVVGGWAIDLFLGTQTREHEDLEIAILRPDLPSIRHTLAGFVFHALIDGEVRALADEDEPPPQSHQNWVLEPDADAWRVDVMIEPGDPETWVFRRDGRITASRSLMVGRTADGIPFLQPHGALLYKAKAEPRPKDEADFESCLPRVDDDMRSWLATALDTVIPDHPWRARLG